MLSRIVTKLLEVGEWYCQIRHKELHIGGTKENDDIYMIRYPFFESKLLTIYIHRFLRSDGEDHHDHPFNFWSYIANGEYTEEVLHGACDTTGACDLSEFSPTPFHLISTRRNRGSLAYRPGHVIHRVVVDEELKYADRHKGPLTIIVFGKRFRTWGFWPKITDSIFLPYGWRRFIPWTTYLGIDPNSAQAKKHQ